MPTRKRDTEVSLDKYAAEKPCCVEEEDNSTVPRHGKEKSTSSTRQGGFLFGLLSSVALRGELALLA